MLGLDRESVELVSHHDAWREAFGTEADRLHDAVGDRIRAVEHIGSTAIPGVPAKPVLDLLVTVPTDHERDDRTEGAPTGRLADLAAARTLHPDLERLGYEPRETDVPGRTFLVRGPPTARTHYLSVAPHRGTFHREKVAFRDYLRDEPDVAAEYATLKRELAQTADDRDAYTDGKSQFVARVLENALPEYAP
ncbi:MAG: GrpB family protein [Halobaculum sp.]